MSISCNAVQEALAWNRTLDDELRAHLRHCAACRAFCEQIATLDIFVNESVDVDIPPGFADRVMSRIGAQTPVVRKRSLAARLLTARSVQMIATPLAVLVTMSNVLRFVVSLLVPNTAWGGH